MRECNFEVNRDNHGVCGFSLTSFETWAECYCISFLTAQEKRKGSITFENGKIIFNHGGISEEEANLDYDIYGISEGGVFSADITPEDAEDLSQLLHRQGKYVDAKVHVRLEEAWGRGFTLYIKKN